MQNEQQVYLTATWASVKDLEDQLLEIRDHVKEIGQDLVSKYKIIASILNEKYAIEDFVRLTDFTSKTLYYCLDPFSSYSAVFFIPFKDNTKTIPVQLILAGDNTFDLRLNPYYSSNALQSRGLSIKDVLLKMTDLDSTVGPEEADVLKEFFNNPPEATESEFEDAIKQKLYLLTKQDDYKLSTRVN